MDPLTPEWICQNQLKDVVSPLQSDDQVVFEQFFAQESDVYRYENSWPFVMQFMKRLPHKYFDGDTIMALAVDHVNPLAATIVRPMGSDSHIKVARLASLLLNSTQLQSVSVRYLDRAECECFLRLGFVRRGYKYPQPICLIPEILGLQGASTT